MTIPNYLALYNLSQIEADILIVSDLTATTGTIYTLFSTTGTITTLNSTTGNITTLNSTTGNITTANITTANITTLITDLWRGTTTSSSMAIGVSGDTGTLTSYRSLIMDANKSITLNATGGKILCNVYTGTATSSNLTLGESGNTGNLDIFKTITSSNTYSGNNTYSGGNTHSGSNTFSGALNTFNNDINLAGRTASRILLTNGSKNVVSSSYNETDLAILSNNNAFTNAQNSFNKVAINTTTNQADTDLEIWGTNPKIALYSASAGGVYIDFIRGNRSFGADGFYDFRVQNVAGYFSIINGVSGVNTEIITMRDDIELKGNVNISANKSLTLTAGTGKIFNNVYTGTATNSNLTLGESGNTGNLQIFKTITSSNTYSGNNTFSGSNIFSGATNTFNNKILCNLLTGTATSSTIEIGESGDTGLIRTRKDLYIGSTPFSSNKGIYCNYFDTLAGSDTINFSTTQTTGNINIQPSASNGSIVIGNTTPASDSGTLTINKNTILPANKSITLNTTGGKILCNVYTGTATSSNLTLGESGNSGNLQIFKTITSSNTYSGNNTYSGVNTFSGATNTFSNEILCSIYSGLTTSTNFQLGKSGDSARVNCFRDLYIQTGKIVDSEVIQTNTLRAISDLVVGNALGSASNIFLVNSITANESLTIINGKNLLCNTYRGTAAGSNISLFSSTTGSLTLGGVSSGISLADNTTLATGRNLTLSTTGKIVVDTLEGAAPGDNIVLFNTSTTPNITIASGLTLGAMFLGNLANNNPRIWIYNDLWLGTTATNRTIYSNSLRSLQNSDSSSLYNFTTTGSVNFGGALTSGNINLHNPSFTTGRINLQAPTIVSTLQAVSATSGTTNIFTNTTTGSTINLGTGATTSIINIGTGLTTGRIRLYNDRIHIGAGSGSTTTTGTSTQALYCVAIGTNTQTTGAGINSIAIGANAGQTNQAANSIVLNASGVAVNGATAGSFYVRPMGAVGSFTNFVSYNAGTYEVYYTPSSAKYKDNIINLDRDFDDVLKLQSREYRFNQRGNDLHIGYIAEEVYDINKEFSTTNEDGGEPANIAWFNIVLYQNEVIKRLDKELKELKLRVDNLEI